MKRASRSPIGDQIHPFNDFKRVVVAGAATAGFNELHDEKSVFIFVLGFFAVTFF